MRLVRYMINSDEWWVVLIIVLSNWVGDDSVELVISCARFGVISVSMYYASAFIADYGSSGCWCVSDCVVLSGVSAVE